MDKSTNSLSSKCIKTLDSKLYWTRGWIRVTLAEQKCLQNSIKWNNMSRFLLSLCEETCRCLDSNSRKYDSIKITVIKLLYHLLHRPLQLKCGEVSRVSSGWGVSDPEQARERALKARNLSSRPNNHESLMLMDKYWLVKVISRWSSDVLLDAARLWGLQPFIPSQWAGEAAEWPASTDPPERPWCSAGQSPSGRKRCSWQTSPSSVKKKRRAPNNYNKLLVKHTWGSTWLRFCLSVSSKTVIWMIQISRFDKGL